MYCKRCRYELKDGWNVCPKCSEAIVSNDSILNAEPKSSGAIVSNDSILNAERLRQIKAMENIDTQELPTAPSNAVIYLAVYFASTLLCFIPQTRAIASVVALIAIVTGFIKCPENRAIKVLFWLTLAWIVCSIIFSIIIMAMCVNALADCGSSWR